MRSQRDIRQRVRKIENLSGDADDQDEGGPVLDAEFYGYREALLWVLEEDHNDPFE